MNKRAARFYVLIVSLVFLAQLSLVSPAGVVGQGNRATMTRSRPVSPSSSNSSQGQNQWRYRCRRRCATYYRRCLYYAGSNRGRRRACYNRYRRCLRQCG